MTSSRIPDDRLMEFIGKEVYCVETRHGHEVSVACFTDPDDALAYAKDETERSIGLFLALDPSARQHLDGRWWVNAFRCHVDPDDGPRGWHLDGPWFGTEYIFSSCDWSWARDAS